MDETFEGEVGMAFFDSCKLWGYLVLEVFNAEGELIDKIEGPNVITDNGRNQLLGLGGGLSGYTPITRMAVGDGGAGLPFNADNLYAPISFVKQDTDLRNPLNVEVTVDSATIRRDLIQLTFVGFFASAGLTIPFHGDPHVINEIALKSGISDNYTVALRSFRAIPFDPTDSVQIKATWTIGQS